MDEQKSYGKNYDKTKLKHKFSIGFALCTLTACAVAVGIVAFVFGVL